MIKVSVMYPDADGARFDIDYYCTRHMPMVRDRLGAALQGLAVDHGLGGAAPGSKGPYLAAGHLFFESVDAFHQAFDPHAKEIMGDLPNFTNAKPVVQVADVVMNASRSEKGSLHLHKGEAG